MLTAPSIHANEVLLASRALGNGLHQNSLAVPAIHCGACVARVERVLGSLAGVERARVNLSTRRVTIAWSGEVPPPLIETLAEVGYEAHLGDFSHEEKDPALRDLVRSLAVTGFASGNIMMLSVGIWSGADAATRDLFHLLSAVIALPAVAYSGRVFFRSAWQALRHGRTNMDVPISVGVLLAVALSLYETIDHGPHAYFDASVSLLFFLLVGRTLDHVMRERARTAVKGLARLAARGATVLQPDGAQRYVAVGDIRPGMILMLAAGDRVPVDGVVAQGRSELDVSLVSGESLPRPVEEGDSVQAGTLNVGRPLTVRATAAASDSFLAEMTRMMEAAESGRSRYRRIADRAARLYAPAVHLTALLTGIGWMVATGDLHRAVTVAIAVLIVTCPCALGLAVPMVQVVAAQRLFQRGVMVKDGGALERLAEVDHVVLDKTGTLTRGRPELVAASGADVGHLGIAAALAAHSRHPYAQAIVAAARERRMLPVVVSGVEELPGSGLQATAAGQVYRLGRSDWVLDSDQRQPGVALSRNGDLLATFAFEDRLRLDAREAVAALKGYGLQVEICSGDHEAPVREVASQLQVACAAAASPAAKVKRLAALARDGRRVLMVGDGLNDTPALAAAHVSMAPASAADVGRNAADLVFLRDGLMAVLDTIDVSRRARALVRQNLALAVGYNALAVPIAIAGHMTPLVAAIAMSLSSIVVVANALRLSGGRATTDLPSAGGMLHAQQPATEAAA